MKRIKYPVLLGSVAGIDPREMVAPGVNVRGKVLRAFSIAHAGTIAPLVGGIKTLLTFPEGALKSVLASLKLHVPAMPLHETDRADPLSHAGRNMLARVVGKGLKMIGGKLHAIAVLAFDRQEDADAYPKISLESESFDFRNSAVRFVNKITGLALLPEKGYQPAFPESGAAGAAIQCAVLCAYEEDGAGAGAGSDDDARIKSLENEIANLKKGKEKVEITFTDVEAYIKNNSVKPSKLFTSHDILGEISIINGKLALVDGDAALTRPLLNQLSALTLVDGKQLEEQKTKAAEFDKIKINHDRLARGELAEQAKTKIPEILKSRNLSDAGLKEKYLLNSARLGRIDYTGDLDKDLETYLALGLKLYEGDAAADAAGSDNGKPSTPPSGGAATDGPDDIFKSISDAAAALDAAS